MTSSKLVLYWMSRSFYLKCKQYLTPSLVLCVRFVDRCLFFCLFSIGHCVGCSSSIYGFWLPLWYLQTLFNFKTLLIWFAVIKTWRIRIPLTGLTSPHVCSSSKSGPRFPTTRIVVFCVPWFLISCCSTCGY